MNLDDRNPLLRPLDFQPVQYQGQRMWLLRDPLQLSPRQLLLPEPLALLAELCNGRRTRPEIAAAFAVRAGFALETGVLEDTLAALDDACLLQNERAAQKQAELLVAYRAQPFRPPALAGPGYPADADELTAVLESYGAVEPHGEWHGRGLVSPHIDYHRGGPVYAQVWQRAAAAILAADVVVILGTDHMGGLGTLTLTELPYATPYGVLPADTDLVDKLARAIGSDAAFADELNHRQEHSIELSAVWLHYLTARAGLPPKPMVPVLVGSFHHFMQTGRHPADDERLSAFAAALRAEAQTRHVVIVASVDLAHVGPNFGDPFAMDTPRRTRLAGEDSALMAAALRGDAQAWFGQITAVGDRNRICGFSPTYLLLDLLGETSGVQVAYDQCSADPQDTSLVSICGLLLD